MATQPAENTPYESTLYLMLARPEKMQEMNLMVMKKILESNCTPLLVTVNKPGKVLAKLYAKEGISTESFYIVDAVTQYSGGEAIPSPRVRYVTNPANLTDLGIAITEIIKQMPEGKKCIIFDSVSMFLIHIPSASASKFLHFIINKLKLEDISGIFLCVDKGMDPVILSQMSAFVDQIADYEIGGTSSCRL